MAPITAIYAALSGLMLLFLAALVVRARRKYRTGIGVGNEPGMERAVRVHANFIEYVPLALLLMLIGELNDVPDRWLHGCGIVLLCSRCLHAYGLGAFSGRSFGRFWGTAGTWATLLVLAAALLARTVTVGT